MLKQKLLFAATSLFALMLVSTGLRAQYDDMYYDPDEFQSVETNRNYAPDNNDQDQYAERDTRRNSDYADDYYDYYYSSRIRRFNRPYSGFGYYDPVYVDMAYYDPFFRPAATTVLIYNSFGGGFYRPGFATFGGFNSWNRGYASGFGWNNPYYGNRWDRGFGNSYYGNPYGYGYGSGFGSPFGYGASAYGYGGFGGYGNAAYYCPSRLGQRQFLRRSQQHQ